MDGNEIKLYLSFNKLFNIYVFDIEMKKKNKQISSIFIKINCSRRLFLLIIWCTKIERKEKKNIKVILESEITFVI